MFNYCIKSQKGRNFVLGIFLTITALIFKSDPIFLFAIVVLGYYILIDVLVDIFIKRKLNVDLLMILSVIGSVSIHYFEEAAVLLIIFLGSEILENFVSSKSTESVKSLVSGIPSSAQVIFENGEIKVKKTTEVKVGQMILVNKGEQIPLDGVTLQKVILNESVLTGESIPVVKEKNDQVYAGTINLSNSFKIVVTKLAEDSNYARIIELVKKAQNRPSKTAQYIERIKTLYVVIVLSIVPLFIIFLHFVNNISIIDSLYRGMVLLTVASPCALIVSAIPATLSAINTCAKNGILIKDGNFFSELNKMDILFSDKTGTLTTGNFKVMKFKLDKKLLKQVVYMEKNSCHPLAKAIVNHFDSIKCNITGEVKEIPGYGLIMGNLKVGSNKFLNNYENPFKEILKNYSSKNIVYVGIDDCIVGYFILEDTIRSDIKEFIDKIKQKNIEPIILTGDDKKTAEGLSRAIGIETCFSECTPLSKNEIVDSYIKNGKTVAMIGDGINDAPSLALADISIAMGSGTASAMENSDMVIVDNKISKINFVFSVSKKLKKIVIENILLSVGVIISLICLTFLNVLDLTKGVVFHELSTILVILNSLRMLRLKIKD